ncbi:S-adenosyl-L-methionine-dependent methyltransferase [Coprinopsis marcescibilis]|uniref:S-adenosyl-L-methionine-dependent methyltransferase n=1 Tax=Coprinopsis marcescibilis TaxID=230819 RepID=A0A5C3K8R2_COPMA|nr:S-adenosyl-L-methionine-dependent methyltransferase [Coprinopsis marcescibilis]
MATSPLPPIQLKVQQTVNADDPTTWDILWKQNVTPWDAGEIQPSLIEVIENSGIEFPRLGRALVPGCGTGYDVLYLANALGVQAFGMDISETAIEAATRYRDASSLPGHKNANFIKDDFFRYKVVDDERFDLIVDHTFFCAIHPSQRVTWGKKMAELIKPGGFLITNAYPMLPEVETGPPYYLRPDHYEIPLKGTFDKIYDKVPEKSSPSHQDKERILVWKRKSE